MKIIFSVFLFFAPFLTAFSQKLEIVMPEYGKAFLLREDADEKAKVFFVNIGQRESVPRAFIAHKFRVNANISEVKNIPDDNILEVKCPLNWSENEVESLFAEIAAAVEQISAAPNSAAVFESLIHQERKK
jgi:hypothetical protein